MKVDESEKKTLKQMSAAFTLSLLLFISQLVGGASLCRRVRGVVHHAFDDLNLQHVGAAHGAHVAPIRFTGDSMARF